MRFLFLSLLLITSSYLYANNKAQTEDKVELTTTFIKGNKELPQTLYIVPWQTIKKTNTTPENMVLHSLYGDIFQPVTNQELTK